MSIKQSDISSSLKNEITWEQIYRVKQWIYQVCHKYLEEKCKHKIISHICFFLVNIVIERLITFSNKNSNTLSKNDFEIFYKYHTNVLITDDNMQLYSLVALVNIFERTSLLSYLGIDKEGFYNACQLYSSYDFYKVDSLLQNIPELFMDLDKNDYEIFLEIAIARAENYQPTQLKNIIAYGLQTLETYLLFTNQSFHFPPKTLAHQEQAINCIILRVHAAFWVAHYFITNEQTMPWKTNWIQELPLNESLKQNSVFISMLQNMQKIVEKQVANENVSHFFELDLNIYNYNDETIELYQMIKKSFLNDQKSQQMVSKS